MATAIETQPATILGDQCVALRDVGWKGYNAVLKLRGERPRPRIVYLDGSLFLMTTSLPHERFKKLLDQFVVAVAHGLRIPFYQAGSPTLRRKAKRGGVEGDETYYFTNATRMRGKRKIDLKVDPPPDLAIEVVHSNPVAASLEVYRRLGVPEVWACEDHGLKILLLQPDGQYAESKSSKVFPVVTAAEIFAWVTRPDADEQLEWLDALQKWVRDDLARRPGASSSAAKEIHP